MINQRTRSPASLAKVRNLVPRNLHTAGQIILVFISLLLVASVALAGDDAPAAPNSGYEIAWWTVDGGGATLSSGGSYTLGGTIGQPDAGSMSGGSYGLAGGFWGGAGPGAIGGGYAQYLPLILKSP